MAGGATRNPSELHRGRFAGLVLVLVMIAIVASSGPGRELLDIFYGWTDSLMTAHPRAGRALFVLLAAISAMLAFFSSAVLLPVAIYVWGARSTFLLLWTGWFLGGICSYLVGRYLGRDVVRWVVAEDRLVEYERKLARDATFARLLLFHFAVPSEVPGYLLGLLRYPMRTYLLVLALAEVPFAAGAIYLGEAFVENNVVMLVLIGGIGIVISIVGLRFIERRVHATG